MRHEIQVAILNELKSLHKLGRDKPMLGRIATLPADVYTDPERFGGELKTVFRNYPVVVGHISDVKNPGAYILSDWARIPFIVVRNKEGGLRCFLNVCCHRGARLVSGQEPSLRAFVCPYHGWSYNLNGKSVGIPKPYDFPGINRDDYSLFELPVAEYAGLIWVGPTQSVSMDLKEYLGPIGDDLIHFELNKLITYKRTRTVKKANWKLLIQTYLEGYHVPHLHRTTLARSFEGGVITHYEYGSHMRLVAARTDFNRIEAKPESDWRILDVASVYYSLFPNTFFIMHPDYVSINTFWPEAPDSTIWTHQMLYDPSLFAGDSGQKALAERFHYTNDTVFDLEDFAIAEKVQAGIPYSGKKTHTFGLEEGLLVMFQNNIDHATSLPA